MKKKGQFNYVPCGQQRKIPLYRINEPDSLINEPDAVMLLNDITASVIVWE